MDKLRALFIFKYCISTYNYIFFSNDPENWIFIACIPKKSLILAIFDLFWAVFFVTIVRSPFLRPENPLALLVTLLGTY